jgi:hypothetical protein
MRWGGGEAGTNYCGLAARKGVQAPNMSRMFLYFSVVSPPSAQINSLIPRTSFSTTDSRSFRLGVNIFSRCAPVGRPDHSCPLTYSTDGISLYPIVHKCEKNYVPLLCVRSNMLKYWTAGTQEPPILCVLFLYARSEGLNPYIINCTKSLDYMLLHN